MAFDAFLKMDGVTENLPGGEMELDSFSWGVSNSATAGSTGGQAGGGKPSFQDFSFTLQVGKQSPNLFEAAVMGKHINNATLTVTDKAEPITIHFSDVVITSYKLDEGALNGHRERDGGPELGAPTESVSFNFLKVDLNVGGTTTSGSTGGGNPKLL
jgi:type VI secretion system secreted protein Hcp